MFKRILLVCSFALIFQHCVDGQNVNNPINMDDIPIDLGNPLNNPIPTDNPISNFQTPIANPITNMPMPIEGVPVDIVSTDWSNPMNNISMPMPEGVQMPIGVGPNDFTNLNMTNMNPINTENISQLNSSGMPVELLSHIGF